MDIRFLLVPWTVLTMNGFCSSSFVSDEEALRRRLLSSYNPNVRPNHTVHVSVAVNVSSLTYIDLSEGTMSLGVIFFMLWQDQRLVWNTSDFGGLVSVVTAAKNVWMPPMVIRNERRQVEVLGSRRHDVIPVTAYYSGTVVWLPPRQALTSCDVTIAFFPFDTQECHLDLVAWGFSREELTITPHPPSTSFFQTNGQFELLETSSSVVQSNTTPTVYSHARFTFVFRRRWQFWLQNLVAPVVGLHLMTAVAFLLPLGSGERSQYSLTLMLTFVFFLTLTSTLIPAHGTRVSLLQLYVTLSLGVGAVSSLASLWLLTLYHRPDTHTLPAGVLVTFARRWRRTAPPSGHSSQPKPDGTSSNLADSTIAHLAQSTSTTLAERSRNFAGSPDSQAGLRERSARGLYVVDCSDVISPAERGAGSEVIPAFGERDCRREATTGETVTCKELAVLFNRLFLYFVLFVGVGSTLVLLAVIVVNY